MRARREPLLLAGLATVGTVVLAAADPRTTGLYPPCPLRALTGLSCPLCGGLRAVHDLAHLDLAAAWGMNPAVVLLAPVAVVLGLRWLRRPRAVPVVGPRTALALVVALVVLGVLRNVPALVPLLGPAAAG